MKIKGKKNFGVGSNIVGSIRILVPKEEDELDSMMLMPIK